MSPTKTLSPGAASTSLSAAFPWRLLGLVLALALAWRLALAAAMPALSRDGVTFCWYARALGNEGLDWLRSPHAQQHPLFPALLLVVQQALTRAGLPDGPLAWQYSGQAVALAAGLVVIVLTAVLAWRLIRLLALPLSAGSAAIFAALLTTLLPLNNRLSADVMSDQVHLAFYLAAVVLMVRLDSARAALAAGLATGLAFLTRQEGIVPLAAGVIGLLRTAPPPPRRALATRTLALLAGFLVLATPYWAIIGGFSQKKDPLRWLRPDESPVGAAAEAPPAGAPAPDALVRPGDLALPELALGKLELLDLSWYALVPYALYVLFRAGRVVIPLLALLPLVNLRRRTLEAPLAPVTVCLAGHFALAILLLARFRYLDPRHMLVMVVLLIPFAAFLLTRLVELLRMRGRRGAAAGLLAVVLLPLGLRSLAVPNAHDGYLREAAAWLVADEPAAAGKTLLSGSSPRRVAFYADLYHAGWNERAEDYDGLVAAILDSGAAYFAIEVATPDGRREHFERAGNRDLLNRLLADPALAGRLRPLHVQPGRDENELHLLAILPP